MLLLLPTSGDLPDPGIELSLLCLLHWQAYSLPLSHLGNPASLLPIIKKIQVPFTYSFFSVIQLAACAGIRLDGRWGQEKPTQKLMFTTAVL